MKVRGAVPHWPRWYCSLIGHWGYLREFQKLDDGRSEYLCESCGWRGMRKRPSKKLRSYWF